MGRISTIMTDQPVIGFMVGKADITGSAIRDPSTGFTLEIE
jgi:hypothetical protein